MYLFGNKPVSGLHLRFQKMKAAGEGTGCLSEGFKRVISSTLRNSLRYNSEEIMKYFTAGYFFLLSY